MSSLVTGVRSRLTVAALTGIGIGALSIVLMGALAFAYMGSTTQFLPHAYCLTFQPGLLALHGASDVLIALSYFSIPAGLLVFAQRRPDVPMRWLLLLFGAFIVACGATHLMALLTLWWPAYWLDGGVKAITAAVSLPTAVAVWFMLPKALELPSRAELEAKQQALAAEVAERLRAEDALRQAQADLERRVAERTDELAETTRQLQESAVERERLLASERAARADAERATRLKDELLASVSHELRTPLSAIMSGASVLQALQGSGAADASPQAKLAIDIIARNARAQARLIDDLLDVARIVAGQLKLEHSAVGVQALIERTVQSTAGQAQARRVTVEVQVPEERLYVTGDADRLTQVLSNLLSNAIKFSAEGGRVEVLAQRHDHHVQIAVRDHGEGIAPEFLPQLFEPFKQGSGDPIRRRAGLGLGLSIAQRLAQMHGGEVTADSAGRGHGAMFTVHLPLRRDGLPASATPPGTPADLAGCRILMVDDEHDLLQMQAAAVRLWGAEVTTVASAEAALQALEDARYDVLISDLGMPELDGFALIERWRARERQLGRRSIPAIALSGFTRVQDALRAEEAGYDLHVPKPVEGLALALAISRLRAGLAGEA